MVYGKSRNSARAATSANGNPAKSAAATLPSGRGNAEPQASMRPPQRRSAAATPVVSATIMAARTPQRTRCLSMCTVDLPLNEQWRDDTLAMAGLREHLG